VTQRSQIDCWSTWGKASSLRIIVPFHPRAGWSLELSDFIAPTKPRVTAITWLFGLGDFDDKGYLSIG
jgi:hypothetical protein